MGPLSLSQVLRVPRASEAVKGAENGVQAIRIFDPCSTPTRVVGDPFLNKGVDMEEYVCHYLTDAVHSARAVYHADELPAAMAMHNAALPEFRNKVLRWVGPTGITFLFHDSKMRMV